MGIIDLFKDGFFGRFVDFSNLGALLGVWGAFLLGVLVQTLLNKKTHKPEVQWAFLVILVILIIVCQIGSNFFVDKNYGALLGVFGHLVCALFGSGICGLVWYIKRKSAKKDAE